jgi:hypothetical protein
MIDLTPTADEALYETHSAYFSTLKAFLILNIMMDSDICFPLSEPYHFQCDIENATIDTKALTEFCEGHKFIGWFATSAKDNLNIGKVIFLREKNILSL